MEKCFFLDVGQGNASVLRLPGRSVMVFDAGPQTQGTVWNFLHANKIRTIHSVVLSHNDIDHIRGFFKIAETYGRQIENIYVLQDRREVTASFDAAISLHRRGIIPRPRRAEVRDLTEPLEIFCNDRITVEILYPDFVGNIEAIKSGNPNRSSVIARICCKGRTAVLFPGDSTVESWRDLDMPNGHLPVETDILVVPHHGGLLAQKSEDLEWLFQQGIKSKIAIVSVGSSNQHGHPRSETIKKLVEQGVQVICTQITPNCHSRLEELNPGVLRKMVVFSRSCSHDDLRHIGCAGTIVAYLEDNRANVLRQQMHRNDIVGKKITSPMCLHEK